MNNKNQLAVKPSRRFTVAFVVMVLLSLFSLAAPVLEAQAAIKSHRKQ
ncbi:MULTISPECIES: hypothetical protein [Enterococcus]|nr:hypothetical protein [Enterococcus gallinarum]MDT2722302.1 hypothetical protein [Enterococcus gallinarum]